MQTDFQVKINQGNKDVRDLQASLDSLKEERDREFKKIQHELAERAANYARREQEWEDYRNSNTIDPTENANREAEMDALRQQLRELIEKGVWYQIGEFFEETVDDIKKWWKGLY
ncbi:hypothetical protein VE04_09644 [Pseudogymnoascus sp. 24MN13]|nr:hypothetical protein VE04_09644 [Pseudogymnoascus sp. 24MN13]